jgi:Coenzyme PQQ synthesis protein D (PqqD)
MPLRNKAVLWRELDGEAILLDPKQGCSYNLNQVGTLVWRMLDGQHTTADIVEAICEAYEVEPELALQDLELLLGDLRSNNLLSSGVSPSDHSE